MNTYIYIYLYIYIFTWNPSDPCFDWKRPCFGGFNQQIEDISRFFRVITGISELQQGFATKAQQFQGIPESNSQKVSVSSVPPGFFLDSHHHHHGCNKKVRSMRWGRGNPSGRDGFLFHRKVSQSMVILPETNSKSTS